MSDDLRMAAAIARQEEHARAVDIILQLLDHLTWCSGSNDFAEGGPAEWGWRGYEPVRAAARAYCEEKP